MHHRILPLLGVLLVAAPVMAQRTAVGGASGLETALPANTTLYVRVADIETFHGKLLSSPVWQVTKTDALRPAIEEVRRGWEQVLQGAREEAGIDLDELFASCKGEASIAVGDLTEIATTLGQALATFEEPEIKPESIPILVSVDARSSRDQFYANVQKLLERAKTDGNMRTTEADFQGGKLITLMPPEGVTDGPEAIYLGETKGRFLLALSKPFLQSVMANLGSGGSTDALASNAKFRAAVEHTKGTGDAMIYINVAQLAASANTALKDSMFAFFWQKARSLFIGESFNNLVMTVSLEDKGVLSRSFAHNEGASDGVLGWFKAAEITSQPSPLIPGEAMTFSSAGINFGQIINAIREVATTAMAFSGQAGDIDTVVEQNIGVSLSALEAAFGQRIDTYQTAPASEANPAGDLSMIFELKDDAPLKKLLEKISEMTGGEFAPKPYLNRSIYTAEAGPGMTPSIVATDKLLVFSLSRENVEKTIRRIGKDTSELGNSDSFRKVAGSYFPTKVAVASWSSQDAFEMSMKSLASLFGASGDAPDWVPGAFEAMGKTLGASVGYAKWQDDGLYSESWLQYR